MSKSATHDEIAIRCDICGERIPFPEPRMCYGEPGYYCTSCDDHDAPIGTRHYPVEFHDLAYHGGRFGAGEW